MLLTMWYIHSQSCPTLCNPMDCSPQGSPVHGILQSVILEWLSFPPPGDLPNPGIEPVSPARSGGFFTTESPGKPHLLYGILSVRISTQ